jgi:short subunit dehydrogenase-like uncharacterized protein
MTASYLDIRTYVLTNTNVLLRVAVDMKIAVYGATGYTGRLVAAELEQRGSDLVLSGRDPQRLRALAANRAAHAEVRPAAVDDEASLTAAFGGCDAVINCAGPFTPLGQPVVRAAIAAGCHYVDTAAEQAHIRNVFDSFADPARVAGVTVVPATGYDIIPGDLIAHLTGTRVEPLERLTLGNGTARFAMTRGTVRSTLVMMKGGDVTYADGTWVKAGRVRRPKMLFPGERRPTPMIKLATGEAVTVPRHVRTRSMQLGMRADALAPRPFAFALPAVVRLSALMLRTPMVLLLDRLVGLLPEGPQEDARRGERFAFVAEAVGEDGRLARGVIEGTDIYGITAVMAVEAAQRLVRDGAPAGVLAPAQAFDPADFLATLATHGVRWSVELR